MRYTVVCPDAVFYTEWLMFPDWNHVYAIIDNENKQYVQRLGWTDSEEKPIWKPIIEDSL